METDPAEQASSASQDANIPKKIKFTWGESVEQVNGVKGRCCQYAGAVG